ncbi:InlB B-repeat-containing protein [Tenacibaculum amylolyticum]|uniref:InlB B-repeat-containing protein n=1 Tax=Tenacibaculum amylolyticum TaxID=104269 RepID=UPI00389584BD
MKAKLLFFYLITLFLSVKAQQVTTVYTGLNTPIGIEAFENELYIAEFQSNRIVKLDITSNSPVLQVVANANNPEGLALQGTNLRITRTQEDEVSTLDLQAAIPTAVTRYSFRGSARAITYNPGKELYVSSAGGGTKTLIHKFYTATSAPLVAEIPGNDVRGMTIIGNFLYAAERSQGRIYRVDLTQPNSTPPVIFKSGITKAYELDAVGNSLYITTETGRLLKINDVTVNNPSLTTLISGGFGAFAGIKIIGQDIYISGWGSGGRILKYRDTTIPTRLYVNKDATGANNGSSWTNAYTSLTSALNSVPSNAEIWVAKGTYKPSASVRTESFILGKSNVKLYGGFAGNEATFNERNILLMHTTNKTVLSGDLEDNDDNNLTFNNATRLDNSFRLVNVVGNNVVIDGVTISGGYASASTGEWRFGAALSTPDVSQFTIKNSIIENNVAMWAAGLDLTSDALTSAFTVENCTISNNITSLGASAFYVTPPESGTVDFTIINSLIKNNGTIDNGTARRGVGSAGGWIRAFSNGCTVNTTIVNNTFVNNSNTGTGASDLSTLGMSRMAGVYGTVNFANNIFWNNTANNGQVAFSLGSIVDNNLANNLIVFNSIDQNDFSRVNSNNRINTSNADPLFLDAANNDFTLQASSPGIDAGDNSKIAVGVTTDLLGNNRIFNTIVDMGAYEFGNPVRRGLTINATNGSVTTNPNPTNGTYDDGTSVTLTATPNAGYQFDGWSGDASGTTNPLTITMDSDKTVTAMFSKIQRTLTIFRGNGLVITNPDPTNGTYDDGTNVTLRALPIPGLGYQFDGWSGDVSGTTNPITITMDSDKTVTATFSKIQRTLIINSTNGSVSTNPNPTNGTYDNGTSVTLTATPNAGYQFDGWSGDATGTTNPLTITIDADKTITAMFSKIQRTLTINATSGAVHPNPTPTNGTYDEGTNVTLSAVPLEGYQFDSWSGDASGTTNPLTITMDADKTIIANFSAVTASVVDEEFNTNIKIYPNPSKGIIHIDLKIGYELKKVTVYNTVGKEVLKTEKTTIDISDLVDGMYIIKVTDSEGKVAQRKIIKQ